MSDVQQVEPSRKPTKTKKRDRVRKQPDKGQIKYDDKAIAEGKRLAAALQNNERKLGELADRLEPKYADKTLARFAEAIGVNVGTLKRCRSAYRAWKGIDSGSGASFAVLKALQGHPARAKILKNNPKLSKRQATGIMRTWRQVKEQEQDQAQEQGQEQDKWQERLRNLEPQLRWKVIEARHFLDEAKKFALDAHKKYGHQKLEHLDLNVLLHAVDEPDKLVTTLRLGGQAANIVTNTLADEIECAFTTPAALLPPPMFDDNSTSDEAASGDGSLDEDTPDNTTPDQTT
jgi:hypothetical protein